MSFNKSAAASGGLIGSGIASYLSDWNNPYEAGMPSLRSIPETVKPYYDPYIESGRRALPQLENQYGSLLTNPGQRLNEMGQNFHESPGFKFALQQALQGAGHAAAAGGMAGSPQHEQQNMELGTQIGNQDYNQWLQHVLGLYGQGMQGEQGLANSGYQAGNELAQTLGNVKLQEAMMKILGENAENEHTAGGLGSLLGGAGSLITGSLFS